MSFINVNVKEAKPVEVLPEGRYQVRVVAAEEVTSSSGKPMLRLTIEATEYPYAEPIFHNVLLPTSDMPEKQVNLSLNNLKVLLVVFGVPFTDEGFNTEDFIGKIADVDIGIRSYDGRNFNQLKLPRSV